MDSQEKTCNSRNEVHFEMKIGIRRRERFVRAWKVSTSKLQSLVGSHHLTVSEIIESEKNEKCRVDVFRTLGRGNESKGKEIAENALAEILNGRLDEKQAYSYACATELLLNHAALPLAKEYVENKREPTDQIVIQSTYYIPNKNHGIWNSILNECRLTALSKIWGVSNFTFPWNEKAIAAKSVLSWPIRTVIPSSALADLDSELRNLTQAQIWQIPANYLAAENRVANKIWIENCREEIWRGLQRLQIWIAATQAQEKSEGPAWAIAGNSLVLMMAGDQ
jgi:hypothetical protein